MKVQVNPESTAWIEVQVKLSASIYDLRSRGFGALGFYLGISTVMKALLGRGTSLLIVN